MELASRTILAVRAFGDFTILVAHANAAISTLQPHTSINNSTDNYKAGPDFNIIASTHLLPLYNVFLQSGAINSLPIEFVDLGINGSLLRFFTNKQLLGMETIPQVQKLKAIIEGHPDETIYLEQSARLAWLQPLVNKKLIPVSAGNQVYADYARFFSVELPAFAMPQCNRILILPSSRQAKKNMPDACITAIQQKHPTAPITVGLFTSASQSPTQFSTAADPMKQTVHYSSFEALINLILSHDFVYCPDSAQAHICQLLQKPHFMLYPNQFNLSFATPFVVQHHQYASFQHFMEAGK